MGAKPKSTTPDVILINCDSQPDSAVTALYYSEMVCCTNLEFNTGGCPSLPPRSFFSALSDRTNKTLKFSDSATGCVENPVRREKRTWTNSILEEIQGNDLHLALFWLRGAPAGSTAPASEHSFVRVGDKGDFEDRRNAKECEWLAQLATEIRHVGKCVQNTRQKEGVSAQFPCCRRWDSVGICRTGMVP